MLVTGSPDSPKSPQSGQEIPHALLLRAYGQDGRTIVHCRAMNKRWVHFLVFIAVVLNVVSCVFLSEFSLGDSNYSPYW